MKAFAKVNKQNLVAIFKRVVFPVVKTYFTISANCSNVSPLTCYSTSNNTRNVLYCILAKIMYALDRY